MGHPSRRQQKVKFKKRHAGKKEGKRKRREYCLGELVQLTKNVVKHNYLSTRHEWQTEGQVWRQKIGIPMGNHSSPKLANLFCHSRERNWVLGVLNESGIVAAAQYNDNVRYLDDLAVLAHPSRTICMGSKWKWKRASWISNMWECGLR